MLGTFRRKQVTLCGSDPLGTCSSAGGCPAGIGTRPSRTRAPFMAMLVHHSESDPQRVGGHCSATLARMVEVIGDSARGAEFSLVRLEIDGARIVAADATGLDRDLDGLTLLEAAA